MKITIFGLIFLIFLTTVNPSNIDGVDVINTALTDINFQILPKELVNRIIFLSTTDVLSDDSIQVVINQYVDEIFTNLQNLIKSKHLDTVNIPNETLNLKPTGHVYLKNGKLEDLDTLTRREDVILAYSNKTLLLSIPIKFDDLKFSYDYHTKVAFISISGGVHGSVQNIKVNAVLSFDFKNLTGFLDHYDMKDTGKIHVKFTGNAIVDWLSNAMTSVITTFMEKIIVNEMAKLIRDNIRDFIKILNDEIAKIIHP